MSLFLINLESAEKGKQYTCRNLNKHILFHFGGLLASKGKQDYELVFGRLLTFFMKNKIVLLNYNYNEFISFIKYIN